MTERKTGLAVEQELISPLLMRFRLQPEPGSPFHNYTAGQYIALRRDDCKLTRKTGFAPDGKATYEPELDPWGRQTLGPVTHAYSIASAPSETAEFGWLEFLVALEYGIHGLPGRLSEALFGMNDEAGCEVSYMERFAGDFTLEARVKQAENVLMVGTGTGVAPFVSMMKELHARADPGNDRRYTLVHTHRTEAELAYHKALFDIEVAGRVDFVYIPTLSRPTATTATGQRVGQGRASNVIRHLYDLPTTEQDKLANARGEVAVAAANLALERLVHPVLPNHLSTSELKTRIEPSQSVLLAWGNPASMADLQSTAAHLDLRCEQEAW